MLRVTSKIAAVLAWMVAVVCGLAVQILALFSLGLCWEQDGRPLMFLLVAVSTVLLWVGLILYTAMPQKKFIGLSILTVSGILFLVAAFVIRQYTMPGGTLSVKADGTVGMDSFKLLWRHFSPVLVPILLWLSTLFTHIDRERRDTQEILRTIRSKQKVEPETLDIQHD